MLGASSKSSGKLDKVDTLISNNVEITGNIKTSGTVRFDCKIEGDLSSQGVIIGKTGCVNGNIICNNIIISGSVTGNVKCEDKMHIKDSGSLLGDAEVGTIIIDEGAVFKGICKMKSEINN